MTEIYLLNGRESLNKYEYGVFGFLSGHSKCPLYKELRGSLKESDTAILESIKDSASLGVVVKMVKLNSSIASFRLVENKKLNYISAETKKKVEALNSSRRSSYSEATRKSSVDAYWYTSKYELKNNIIIKLVVSKKGVGAFDKSKQSILFLRIRDTGPLMDISYKNSDMEHRRVFLGRADILSPEAILSKKLLSHPTELAKVTNNYYLDYLSVVQRAEALCENTPSQKVDHVIDNKKVSISKPVRRRKLME